MSQTLIFELDGVRVTSAIIHVGESSYQVANIDGVRVTQFKKCNRVSILTLIFGMGLVIASAVLDGTLPQIRVSLIEIGAAILMMALVLQLAWPRWAFGLVLNLSTSEIRVLTSLKRKFIFDVKQAIEGAFVIRAQLPTHYSS